MNNLETKSCKIIKIDKKKYNTLPKISKKLTIESNQSKKEYGFIFDKKTENIIGRITEGSECELEYDFPKTLSKSLGSFHTHPSENEKRFCNFSIADSIHDIYNDLEIGIVGCIPKENEKPQYIISNYSKLYQKFNKKEIDLLIDFLENSENQIISFTEKNRKLQKQGLRIKQNLKTLNKDKDKNRNEINQQRFYLETINKGINQNNLKKKEVKKLVQEKYEQNPNLKRYSCDSFTLNPNKEKCKKL